MAGGGIPAGRAYIDLVLETARLQAEADRAKRLVGSMSKDIAASAKHANDNLGGFGRGIASAGNNSKLASHHMANLSFQLQDVVVGLTSGQKPMTVFLQQGSQIAQIMAQAGVGVGGLTRNIVGMVAGFARAHPLLLAIAAAAGVAMGAFGLMADEINKTSKVQVSATDVMLGTFDVIKDGISNGVTAAFKAMGVDIGQVWETVKAFTKGAINFVIAAVVAVPKLIADTYSKIPDAFGDAFYSAANLAIDALNWLIKKAAAGLNVLVGAFNAVFGTEIKRVATDGIDSLTNPFKGAMAALGKAGAQSLGQSFGTDYLGNFASAVSDASQRRALNRAAEDAGKEAGSAAGRAAGKAAGDELMKALAAQFDSAFAELAEDIKRRDALLPDIERLKEQSAALEREAKALGLVGWERQRLLLILQHQAELEPLLAQLQRAKDLGLETEIQLLQEKIALLNEVFRQQVEAGNVEDGLAKANTRAEQFNQSLREIIGSLQEIGGLGGTIGNLLAFLSGNFDAIGGPLGALLNIGIDVDPVTKEVRKLGEVLSGAIGGLGKVLLGVLQSAGIGIAAGAAVFGKNVGTTGQILGGIGGILGGMGGTALAGLLTGGLQGAVNAAVSGGLGSLLGGALGSALPVIGTILGGLAGAFIGKLLKKADQTYADFGDIGAGKFEIQGGGSYGSQANQLGQGVLDGLNAIADKLGATVGNFNLKIGVRDGQIRVDPTGNASFKNSISFGEDAEAAVAFALKDAIKDGALMGLRAGTRALLEKEGDLETQLQKALAFEAVFKEISQSANPFMAQLDAMKAQFEQLKAIFAEAGASAEEYAQLQGYLARQQQALVDQLMANYRSTFFTDAESLAFAKQTIAAKLGPLGFGDVDTVAEYRALVAATDALAKPELFGALMELVDAFGVLKDAEEAAAAAAEAAAAQAAAEAEAARQEQQRQIDATRSALQQAYEREAGLLRQTLDRYTDLGKGLRAALGEVLGDASGSAGLYAARLAELRQIGALAAMGNEDALASLPGAGRDFLASAKARAGSQLEFQRATDMVANLFQRGIRASDGMASEAQRQLDALTDLVGLHADLNAGVKSIAQLIAELVALERAAGGTSGSGTGTGATSALAPATAQEDGLARLRERSGGFDWSALWDRVPGPGSREPARETAEAIEGLREDVAALKRSAQQSARDTRKMRKVQGSQNSQGAQRVTSDSVQPVVTA